jgi:5'-deoxynucleotidase YfbR-like HD superfamily hydrolase
MLTGRRLDLLDPSPDDIAIEDIAHGLARVARCNGQTTGEHAFSVAQHALLVEDVARERMQDWSAHWRLAALLHDAPEYVIGDLISPFKAAIGLDYKAFETRLLEAIHARFGLPQRLPADISEAIKTADRIAAFHEAVTLAGFDVAEAERFFGKPKGLDASYRRRLQTLLKPQPAASTESAFLERFRALSAAIAAKPTR